MSIEFYGVMNTKTNLWYYRFNDGFPAGHNPSDAYITRNVGYHDIWSAEHLTLFTEDLALAQLDYLKNKGLLAHGLLLIISDALNTLYLGPDGLYKANIEQVGVDYTTILE